MSVVCPFSTLKHNDDGDEGRTDVILLQTVAQFKNDRGFGEDREVDMNII